MNINNDKPAHSVQRGVNPESHLMQIFILKPSLDWNILKSLYYSVDDNYGEPENKNIMHINTSNIDYYLYHV